MKKTGDSRVPGMNCAQQTYPQILSITSDSIHLEEKNKTLPLAIMNIGYNNKPTMYALDFLEESHNSPDTH